MSYTGHLSFSILRKAAVKHRALHHQFPGLVADLLRLGVQFTTQCPASARQWSPADGGLTSVYIPARYGDVPIWIVAYKPSGATHQGKIYQCTEFKIAAPNLPQCLFHYYYYANNAFIFYNNFGQAILDHA